MLITHDLGVVAGMADRVLVMYAGRQVEIGDRRRDLLRPAHPYTRVCSASLPAPRRRAGERAAAPHRGPAAVVDQPAAGLRVPSALPVRRSDRAVRDRARRELRPVGDRTTRRRATSREELDAASRRRSTRRSRSHRGEPVIGADQRSGRVLERADLVKDFPIRAAASSRGVGDGAGGVGGQLHDRSRARRSASSASRAAASPRPGGCILRLSSRHRARCSSTGSELATMKAQRDARAAAQDPDRLPGPVRVARTRA